MSILQALRSLISHERIPRPDPEPPGPGPIPPKPEPMEDVVIEIKATIRVRSE
jgi:hypothetical protein